MSYDFQLCSFQTPSSTIISINIIIASAASKEQKIIKKYSSYLYVNVSVRYKIWFRVGWVKESVQLIVAALDFARQRLFVTNGNNENNI